jgi:Protein-disulfide isomerase
MNSSNRVAIIIAGFAGLALGGGAVALAAAKGVFGRSDRTAMENVVRDFILANPEIISEAMKRLQVRDLERQADRQRAQIRALGERIRTPFEGAWAGAINGDVTLVVFTDYSCGFCRSSMADIDRLLAADGKLKVVWRELPILGPQSREAARVALAAAAEGKYRDIHRRMFAAGPPDKSRIEAIAAAAGIARATEKATGAAIDTEISANLTMAQQLGISGTPTFVVGDRLLQGAVGYEALQKVIAEERKGENVI